MTDDVNAIFSIGVVFIAMGAQYETIALNYLKKAKYLLEVASYSSEQAFATTIGDMLKRVYGGLTSIATEMIRRKDIDGALRILLTVPTAEASIKLGDIYSRKASTESDSKQKQQLLMMVSIL